MAFSFPLPPLQLSFGAGPSGVSQNGATFSLGGGDWNVNTAPGGSVSGSVSPLLLIGAAVALFLILKR